LGQKRRPAFETLPPALQRRCLQLQLLERGLQAGFDLIEHIRATANRAVTISETLSVSRDPAGRVQLRQIGEVGFTNHQIMMNLRGRAGEGVFANTRLIWEVKNAPSGTFRAPKKRVNCEFFDADKVGKDLVLRHWRPGDRFQPIGMKSPVRLQNLFINQKILRSRRYRSIVGATASGEVFWVEGLRMAERFKLDKNTTHRLKWRWKRL
jgi:tRNA(Ile)-lysidine synthase